MTPEDRQALYRVLESVTRTETKLDGLSDRMTAHEEADEAAHSRIGKLETDRTKLYAYYAAAAVLVPIAMWLLGVLNGSAAAQ